jgi:phage tail-like protein
MKKRTLLRALGVTGVVAAAAVTGAWAAMAAIVDPGPTTVARYALVVEGTEIATFGELGGIVSGLDPSELQLQSGQPLKLPAKRTPPTVTLERGLTSDTALWAWQEAALAGAAGGRKGADLVMFDAEGTPVARYHLEQAWPSKLEIGALEAGASEVLMETVTIVCEKIQRVSV